MKITWQSCGRTQIEKPMMAYWFNKLDAYNFDEVEKAFDYWLKSQSELPTISDILKLCQHKVTIFAKLPSPIAKADNKRHADELVEFVAKNVKPQKDYRAWIKPILANPKLFPDVSLKLAKEAMSAKAAV